MSTPELEQTIAEIALEARDDDVGLWELARALRDRFPATPSTELRLLAAQTCRALLRRGLTLGQFNTDGEFVTWPADGAVDRVLVEWSDLGRDPDIGEIAWLRRAD